MRCLVVEDPRRRPRAAGSASGHGLDLDGLTVAQAGRRRVVKVVVDADSGVDLDQCAEVSRLISQRLDESDVMGSQPYTLEVGSPGVSRPLTLPRHWRRASGRLVRVVFANGGEVTGRVVGADDQAAVLDVEGTSHRVDYAEVGKARVQVEFTRAADSADESDDTPAGTRHDAAADTPADPGRSEH